MSEIPAWARAGKWRDRRKGAKVLIPGIHRRKYRPRRVSGREPDSKYSPFTIARFDGYRLPRDPVAARWYLTILCSRCAGEWVSFKLWAGCQVELKANYWLGWHTGLKVMHSRADAWTLRELRPALHHAVSYTLAGGLMGATGNIFKSAACVMGGHDMRGALPLLGLNAVGRARRLEEREKLSGTPSDVGGGLPLFIRGETDSDLGRSVRTRAAQTLAAHKARIHSPDAMVRLDEQAGLLVVTQGDGARARSVAYPDGVTESVEDLL